MHRQHHVEAPVDSLVKHSVGRHGARGIDPLRPRRLHRRLDLLNLFPPQQTAVAAVRIERRHADARS